MTPPAGAAVARSGDPAPRVTAVARSPCSRCCPASVGLVLAQRAALMEALDEHLDQHGGRRGRPGEAGRPVRDGDLPSEDVLVEVVAADGPLAASEGLDEPLPAGVRGRGSPPSNCRRRAGAAPRAGRRGGDGAGRGQPRRRPTTARRRSPALLLVAVPLTSGVLAGVVWWAVGRALRPVEDIRARVDSITGVAPRPAGARAGRADGDRPARPHDERDARPAPAVGRAAAPLRRRRLARAAQPAGPDARGAGGRRRASGVRRPGRDGRERARRDRRGAAAGRRPAPAGARRRRGAAPCRRDPVDLDDVVETAVGRRPGRRRRVDTAGVRPVQVPGDRASWSAPSATSSTTPSATPATRHRHAGRARTAGAVLERRRRRPRDPGRRPRAGVRAVHPARRRAVRPAAAAPVWAWPSPATSPSGTGARCAWTRRLRRARASSSPCRSPDGPE